jgi:hypothetical protein
MQNRFRQSVRNVLRNPLAVKRNNKFIFLLFINFTELSEKYK